MITAKTAQKFFWQNIVCRFGVPSELTVDNGKQFDSQDFRDFCFSIGTKLAFSSVYHPQSNDVVVAEPPELFQLKCLSHASGAVTHLNRNNPSVPQI
jgi:hypothetical protein